MAGPALSVVLPAFNEAAKVGGTVSALRAAFPEAEIVVSDDGSTDATAAEVEKLAVSDPRLRLVRNPHKGRGGALKSGLAAASGEIVVTIDADLSYGPEDVQRLFEHLTKYTSCDMVIGSCYMPGGKVEGVPPFRLAVSRWGNVILRFAFNGRFWTTTGILRGYRREKLPALLKDPGLVSDGKELYLEFLHKALAAGWSIEEIPATLTWRRGPGGGNFSFLTTMGSHLTFLLARRNKWFTAASIGLMFPPYALVVSYLVLYVFNRLQGLGGDIFKKVIEYALCFECLVVVGTALFIVTYLSKLFWERFLRPKLPPPSP